MSAPSHHVGAFSLATNGSFTYTHDGSETITDSFTYNVKDSNGATSNTATVTITITPVNDPPTVTYPGPLLNGEGDVVSIFMTATDPDLEALQWTAAGLPPGLSINSATGEISGTVDLGAAAASPYDVTVTVTDNGVPPLDDSTDFAWTIVDTNRSPILDPIGPKAVDEGSLLGFPATATDPDPSDTLTFSLAGTPPPGASITAGGGFTWTPTEAQGPGSYDITIRVTDNDIPFMGDWDCNGTETPGLYRQSDGFAYIRNSNTFGVADVTFFMGNPSDIPLAGDFNGNGCDTVSIYRPSEQRIYIANTLGPNNGAISADFSYIFGNPSDKPFVGDFNGNGIETIGLHRESTGFVYFRNTHTMGNADVTYFFGDPGDRLVAGDWGVVDGVFTPAVFRPSNQTFFFRHTNTQQGHGCPLQEPSRRCCRALRRSPAAGWRRRGPAGPSPRGSRLPDPRRGRGTRRDRRPPADPVRRRGVPGAARPPRVHDAAPGRSTHPKQSPPGRRSAGCSRAPLPGSSPSPRRDTAVPSGIPDDRR